MQAEPKNPGTPDRHKSKNLRLGRPKKHEFYERCLDCETNEHLDNVGNPIKGSPVGNCSSCVSGRVKLYTVEDIRKAEQPEKILALIHSGRARLVRPSELVDPYLVKVKKK